MSTRSPMIGGVKRRIFAIYAEDELNNKRNIKYADPPVWNSSSSELPPLTYLHIKYGRATPTEVNLKEIQIKFYYNVEKLGFDFYGASDALYSIERFFREFVTFHDTIYKSYVKKIIQSQTLRTYYRGKTLNFFKGEWFKISKEADAEKSRFGRFGRFGRTASLLKVINMRDKSDIEASVRTKKLEDSLILEEDGRWNKIKTFLNTNLTDEQKTRLKNVRGDYFSYSHRCRLVFLPSLRESGDDNVVMPNLSVSGERLVEFYLDKLTSNQEKRINEFYKDVMQIMKPTSTSGSFTSTHSFDVNPAYFGVTISKENVGSKTLGGSDFKKASYSILFMSGTEFDVVHYENYIIEPCQGLKELFLLTEADTNEEHKLVETKNYDKKNKKHVLKNHPMFDAQLGAYVGSAIKGSFWQFPMIDPQNDDMNLDDYFDSTKSSFIANPAPGQKRTFSMEIAVDDENKKRFFSEYDIVRFKRGKLAIGGNLTTSSIRIEAPNFLENSYCSSEKFYQEHAKFTLNTSGLSEVDSRKERKRLKTHDLHYLSRPQPIKRSMYSAIEMHFFLSDGNRPRQKLNVFDRR